MRLSVRTKQTVGVTALVAVVVVGLSAVYVARVSAVVLEESHARARLLADAILHRARDVVQEGEDPYDALRRDPGVRSIVEAAIYGQNITSGAIVDAAGAVVVHSDPLLVGQPATPWPDLAVLSQASVVEQLRVVYAGEGRTLDVRQPFALDGQALGSIRVAVSTLLIRDSLTRSLRPALLTAVAALLVGVLVAAALAGMLLRPIHVIRSGLTRLGQGERGVTVDLPEGDEFGELGAFFNSVSQQLTADREKTDENSAAAASPRADQLAAYSRKLVALGRLTAGMAHEVKNPLNAMMIHLELLRTKIRNGEVLAPATPVVPVASGSLGLSTPTEPMLSQAALDTLEHVTVIEGEIRRLDQVVKDFLRFTKPEELRLQPVPVAMLFEELVPLVEPEARASGVRVVVDCPSPSPSVQGDAALLRQAFLNLAINACQAMPDGGVLRLVVVPGTTDRVELRVEDTGVGIAPEHLGRIFDLYFTTKSRGTGIGLSMVFRIVQMHDGEVEVESTPRRGTTFRVLLPRAR